MTDKELLLDLFQNFTNALRRTTYDHDALLADQLRWLREAGFVNVDCAYRHTFAGVFLAMKGNQR